MLRAPMVLSVGPDLRLVARLMYACVAGDLYELNLETQPMEWSRPEPTGLPPPPSSKHCCAVVRDHMLIISGERSVGA